MTRNYKLVRAYQHRLTLRQISFRFFRVFSGFSSLFRKWSELRQDAPPLSIAPHKNICGPFVRSEFLPHEFSFRASERTHDSAVCIDTDSNVVGLHHLMSKSSRLDHLQKALLLDDSSIGV